MAMQNLKQVSLPPPQGNPKKCLNCITPQIHVDRPINTMNEDNRLGGSTLHGIHSHLTAKYEREAAEHPGVNLVRHSVAV